MRRRSARTGAALVLLSLAGPLVMYLGIFFFALFGLLRPGETCDGHCDTCAGTCPLLESDHAQR